MAPLNDVLLAQWRDLRRLTYNYLAILDAQQLSLTLPFATSQPLGYQFWCMLGAQESYLCSLRLPIPASWHDEWALSYDA